MGLLSFLLENFGTEIIEIGLIIVTGGTAALPIVAKKLLTDEKIIRGLVRGVHSFSNADTDFTMEQLKSDIKKNVPADVEPKLKKIVKQEKFNWIEHVK